MELFSNWSLTENIVIETPYGEESMQVVEPQLIKEFNYQTDKSWSSFFIAPYQSKRIGYISIGTRPNYVGITKNTPIESGKGTDIAFIKNLTHILSSKKLKPTPYKETGDNFWSKHTEIDAPDDKDFSKSNTPDFKSGSSNMNKSGAISFSRASGSWSFFVKTDNPDYMIKAILSCLKEAAKPLVDNDIIEFYEIVNRMSGKREEVYYSNKGKEEQTSAETKYKKCISYMKYLAMTFLKDYKDAQKKVLAKINHEGVKISGGGESPSKKILPEKQNISFQELYEFVKSSYANDEYLLAFLYAVEKEGDKFYNILEKSAKYNNCYEIALYAIELLKLAGKTNFPMTYFRNFEDDIMSNLYNVQRVLKNNKELQEVVPNELDTFKNKISKLINDYFMGLVEKNEKIELTANEIKSLKAISTYLDIDDEILKVIETLHHKTNLQEKEYQKKQQEITEKRNNILSDDEVKYMTLNGDINEWKLVPQKYYLYNSNEIDLQEFCYNEIVDNEDTFYDAHEQASAEAYENIPEKPSESYGKDQEEIDSDIDYEGDDFANENDDIEEDISEMDDKSLYKLIKEKYRNEFVRWKINKLKEEEEKESWKYEPEPEESRIYEIQQELSEEIAFNEYGLILSLKENNKNVTFTLSSKFKQKAHPIITKMLDINSKEIDEFNERNLSLTAKIDIYYTDNNSLTEYSIQKIAEKMP